MNSKPPYRVLLIVGGVDNFVLAYWLANSRNIGPLFRF